MNDNLNETIFLNALSKLERQIKIQKYWLKIFVKKEKLFDNMVHLHTQKFLNPANIVFH